MARGEARRRADVALEQIEETRDAAVALVEEIDQALGDGRVDAQELGRIVARARRVRDEAEQAQVAGEWTENGERLAVAQLTGRPSANAVLRDVEIARRGLAVGLHLSNA